VGSKTELNKIPEKNQKEKENCIRIWYIVEFNFLNFLIQFFKIGQFIEILS
jgi:hypothetical protein